MPWKGIRPVGLWSCARRWHQLDYHCPSQLSASQTLCPRWLCAHPSNELTSNMAHSFLPLSRTQTLRLLLAAACIAAFQFSSASLVDGASLLTARLLYRTLPQRQPPWLDGFATLAVVDASHKLLIVGSGPVVLPDQRLHTWIGQLLAG